MAKMDKDQLMEFVSKVIPQLPRNLDVEVAQLWIDNPGVLRVALERALRAFQPKSADPDAWIEDLDLATIQRREFKLVIDPTRTIEELVTAGQYTYAHPAHTTAVFGACRNILGDKPVEQKVVAFRIGRNATREQAIRLRARLNLGAICIQHLLALGAKYKQAQRDLNWIINPDDVVSVDGKSLVSYLFGDGARRGLCCYDARFEWGGSTWFLGLSE